MKRHNFDEMRPAETPEFLQFGILCKRFGFQSDPVQSGSGHFRRDLSVPGRIAGIAVTAMPAEKRCIATPFQIGSVVNCHAGKHPRGKFKQPQKGPDSIIEPGGGRCGQRNTLRGNAQKVSFPFAGSIRKAMRAEVRIRAQIQLKGSSASPPDPESWHLFAECRQEFLPCGANPASCMHFQKHLRLNLEKSPAEPHFSGNRG